MKQIFLLSGIMILLSPMTSQAGLIDYSRKNADASAASNATPARAAKPAAQATNNAQTNNQANTPARSQYTNNAAATTNAPAMASLSSRDLTNIIQQVESNGSYPATSPALKAFDTDQDGMIKRYELSAIRAKVQR